MSNRVTRFLILLYLNLESACISLLVSFQNGHVVECEGTWVGGDRVGKIQHDLWTQQELDIIFMGFG